MNVSNIKILECSSSGDKDFSALYAKTSVNGVLDTIENHYQNSKVFIDRYGNFIHNQGFKKSKGKNPVAFYINECYLPVRFGAQFYSLLWYKYLKTNLSLENEKLINYDDYNDCKKTDKSFISQADVIREYMQDENGNKYEPELRGKKLYNNCLELVDFLNMKNRVIIEEGSILNSYAHILGHQVNCCGVMGKGLALSIKQVYKEAYLSYRELYDSYDDYNKDKLLGKCQIVKSKNKYIANLHGQMNWGNNKNTIYTNYDKLKEALFSLKEFAKKNKLSVAIPFNIGCGYANGDWNKVYEYIKEAFKDYYIIIYKK